MRARVAARVAECMLTAVTPGRHAVSTQVEVNGGGFAGDFKCVTNEGDIVTSVHGDEAGASGTVGFGSGMVKLTSDTGDLELSMLPGPLGT